MVITIIKMILMMVITNYDNEDDFDDGDYDNEDEFNEIDYDNEDNFDDNYDNQEQITKLQVTFSI